ncbi:MAG: CBS domain-containing protein [Gammaproteobacteria bacterium]
MFTVTELLFPVQALVTQISGSHLFGHVNVGSQTVRKIMSKKSCPVRTDTSLHDLASVLIEEKLTELPVIEEANVLIGQVNIYQIIKAGLSPTSVGVSESGSLKNAASQVFTGILGHDNPWPKDVIQAAVISSFYYCGEKSVPVHQGAEFTEERG